MHRFEYPDSPFVVVSDYRPAGDQPGAIEEICQGYAGGSNEQVLLGVTGSGKTYMMAHVIARRGKPAILISHNKTLAAQLSSELKRF